jgi:deoxycytidylate deaminase
MSYPDAMIRTCHHCSKVFASEKTLRNHITNQICTGGRYPKTYPCPHCSRMMTRTGLAYHVANQVCLKPNKSAQCQFCDRKFATQASLSVHQESHCPNKPEVLLKPIAKPLPELPSKPLPKLPIKPITW